MKEIKLRKAFYLARREVADSNRRGTGYFAYNHDVYCIWYDWQPVTAYCIHNRSTSPLWLGDGGLVILVLLALALGIVVMILIQKHNRLKKSINNGQASTPLFN